MSSEEIVDTDKQLQTRTVFITATRVVGTAPHHLNPAIVLGQSRPLIRMVIPGDTPGQFEPDSALASLLPEKALRFVKRKPAPLSRILWHFHAHSVARKALREIDANELFVYGSQAAFLALLLRPFLKRGTRIIYHTQDFLEPWRHPIWAWLEALVCRRANRVIVNERNRGRMLQSIYRISREPLVVPTGLLSDWPVPDRKSSRRNSLLELAGTQLFETDPILILHQGPLRANRCGTQLLQALNRLPKRYWLIVTGMDSASLRPLAEAVDLALVERVILTGSMPFQELLELTACCDVGVLLYPNDGIGNFYQAPGRLSENSRSGIPSIASRFPPFEKIAAHHDFLALCDPNDPVEISQAIQKIGDLTPEERAQLGQSAREFALSALTFEGHMNSALEAIQNG